MAVSLTETWRTSAVEANCSRLASGCVSQPNTNVCTRSAPLNLRSRWIQPVSLANSHARSSIIAFKYCSTCVTLVMTRLLSRYPLTDLLISCQIEPCFVISLLKLVPMGGGKLRPYQLAAGSPSSTWLVGAELASALGLGGLAPPWGWGGLARRKNLTGTLCSRSA